MRWSNGCATRCAFHGIESLFLVDDDFFRSPRWEEILTGLIEVKKEYPKLSFMMQVDVDASCYANVAEGETETAKHPSQQALHRAGSGSPDATRPSSASNRSIPTISTSPPKYQNTDDRQHKMKISKRRARVSLGKYQRVVHNWHKVGVSVHAGQHARLPLRRPGLRARRRARRCGTPASTSCHTSL